MAVARLNSALTRQNASAQCPSSGTFGRGRTKPHDRAGEEVAVGDHLVVIDEDDRLASERGRHDEPDVAHRTVAGEADARHHVREVELLEAAVQAADLRRPEDERVDVGELRQDAVDAILGLVFDAGVGRRDEHDDAPEALDALERAEAVRQGAVLVDGGRVVVDVDELVREPAATAGPERRDDDTGGQGDPLSCEVVEALRRSLRSGMRATARVTVE
jgi:hypothetical protein